jgi:signal transduction histidine kinase
LLYGSLFLASGAALLVVTDFLWGKTTNGQVSVTIPVWQILSNLAPPRKGLKIASYPPGVVQRVVNARKSPVSSFVTSADKAQRHLVQARLNFVTTQQHTTDLHRLLFFSAIALTVMVMIALILGWLMAGRFLRPLRTITTAARDISVTNMHERLRLDGPDDELKELGDTFDRLLERLEGSFESQRQFVANASHELRTPLTTMRASLDVAVAKPAPVPEETLALAARLRADLDQVDRLLESFLALARAQRGPETDEVTLPLDTLVAEAIESHAPAIAEKAITVEHRDCPEASVTGSETLLCRMVDNVIANAVKHNEQGGWIRVRTEAEGTTARIVVENGGPVLDEESAVQLVKPFRRLGAERTGSENGTGLGLSIVAAVAEAHDGRLEVHALSEGGLQVAIELPLAVAELAGRSA